MLVESFECGEVADEPVEAAEEAIELMRTLGLNGQLELVRPDRDGGETRLPYREMTADERFVYGVLCPTVAKLEAYSRTPIPLRVLQIASHAKDLGFCDALYVWDAASPAEKDPVLVGTVGPSHSPTKTFILARWGDELEAFAVLMRRAIELKRASLVQRFREIGARIPHEIAKVEAASDAEIVKEGPRGGPSFYV